MGGCISADEIENWNQTIVSLSLGFKTPGEMAGYDEYLIRMIPAKDDDAGSITIPTEVATGTPVWMTRRAAIGPNSSSTSIASVTMSFSTTGKTYASPNPI